MEGSDNTQVISQPNEQFQVEGWDLNLKILKKQRAVIKQMMSDVLIKDQDYGIIPGCGKKPTLLKPGAEKLASVFSLMPEFDIQFKDLEGGHREYSITCNLWNPDKSQHHGSGVGSCSTMENKFRFRYKNGKRTENDNPANEFNTALKMAKKRAFVDAILTRTAASDVFTQDLEDIKANLQGNPQEQPKTQPQEEPPQQQQKPPMTEKEVEDSLVEILWSDESTQYLKAKAAITYIDQDSIRIDLGDYMEAHGANYNEATLRRANGDRHAFVKHFGKWKSEQEQYAVPA